MAGGGRADRGLGFQLEGRLHGYQAKIPNPGAERVEEKEELVEKDGKDLEEKESTRRMEMKPRAETWSGNDERMCGIPEKRL